MSDTQSASADNQIYKRWFTGRLAPLAYRRPALFALGAIVAGVVLGQYALLSHWYWLAFALITVPVAGVMLLRGRVTAGITLTMLTLVVAMAFRSTYTQTASPGNHIVHSVGDGARYRVYGSVRDWPDVREQTTLLTVRVDSTARMVAQDRYEKSRKRRGTVLVRINMQTTDFQYADKVVFEGKFSSVPEKKNPGGFNYARYLRWKDIVAITYLPHHFGIQRNPEAGFSVGGLVRVVRRYIRTVFHNNLEPQPAALATGFLIGEISGIDKDIYLQFRRSGTVHLLAVSGSNVAVALIVLRLFLWPFPIGRRVRYVILILGALFFSFLSHNDPSVVRASVMVTLFLLGRMFQRRIDYHNLIAASGALILLWSPNQLFDVGFQLSFVVSWALILFIPHLNTFCSRWRGTFAYKFLVLPLAIALVAQLSSTPVSLYYFGVAPLNATLSNLIIGPAVGVAVALSLVMLLASLALPLLGAFVGGALNLWLKGILLSLSWLGGPGVWQVRFGHFTPLYAFLALGFVFLLGMSLTNRSARRLVVYAIVLLLIVVPVFGLAPQIFGRSAANPGTTILATRGGVCALIAGQQPALVLSDLVEEPGNQYQYLFKPALQREGFDVDDTIQIVQLSADYTTLVNSLILCDSFQAALVNLTKRSERLWLDYQALYHVNADKYHLRFSSELDTVALVRALERAGGAHDSQAYDSLVTGSQVSSPSALFVGSSLALQISGRLRILYLSAATESRELSQVFRLLRQVSADNRSLQSETAVIVVVERLNAQISAYLEGMSHKTQLKVIATHRNKLLHLSADFAQLITYASETGAVTVVSR